jgi:inhibitor of KinA sporulation pathway (predicted exonuclease)
MGDDVVLVVDVESTCEENGFPDDQLGEIIEIGICAFDLKQKIILESEGIMVKPVHTPVTEYCTNLTSITPETASAGIDFASACAILETRFWSKERTWTSWGNYDRKQFKVQCEEFGVRYPFSARHVNLKKEYTDLYKPGKKQRGMAKALKFLDIPLTGTHHRGVDDARNICKILERIMKDHPEWDALTKEIES